jgi:ESCRT-I complex subunit TSG101
MSLPDSSFQTIIKTYAYPDLTRKDITSATNAYHALRPATEYFTFNDGTSRQLIKLNGVIPINYKGSTYNFPLDVYFVESHPYNPPMVFVRPTSTMVIKASRHVDTNGQVYHPYISEWSHPRSETKELLKILQQLFGESPPLYTRTATTPAATTASQPSGNLGPGYPTTGPAIPTPYGYPNMPYSGYPYGSGWSSNPTPGLPYPSGNNMPYPYPNPGNANPGGYNAATITEDHVRMSLLSAVEDRIRYHFREVEATRMSELEVLRHTKETLEKNRSTLEERIQKAKREKEEVQAALEEVRKSNQQMETALKDMEKEETFNVDEAIDATHPLYKQMVSCYAEEQAITDAIYFLGEALGKSVIDVELFLKKVRNLSRKQFMLRATIQKCRVQAGLPTL